MTDPNLFEVAVMFIAMLYCAAYWLQSDATAWWASIEDDFPRAWVITRSPPTWNRAATQRSLPLSAQARPGTIGETNTGAAWTGQALRSFRRLRG